MTADTKPRVNLWHSLPLRIYSWKTMTTGCRTISTRWKA